MCASAINVKSINGLKKMCTRCDKNKREKSKKHSLEKPCIPHKQWCSKYFYYDNKK